MATWGLHMMIVDKLFDMGIDLDEIGFAIGNIAPDCNIENEDWTRFIPPRETTHWMNNSSKLSADYEGFYNKYILGREFKSNEEISFLLGYYTHLIVDVEFQKFVRDEERVKKIFLRIKNEPNLYQQVKGYPEHFDTLKRLIGKKNLFRDIQAQEKRYLIKNPKASYNAILKKVKTFNHYIDYLPKGAIDRKLQIISQHIKVDLSNCRDEYIFFSQEEVEYFINNTSKIVYHKLTKQRRWSVTC